MPLIAKDQTKRKTATVSHGDRRPLLPAPPKPGSTAGSPTIDVEMHDAPVQQPQSNTREKTKTHAACAGCRKYKGKCDGVRPTCGRCRKRKEICQYEREDTETSSQALRRKINQLQHRGSSHERLYELIQSRSETEALEIFRHIRRGADADKVLQFIQDGDLLLQAVLVPESRLQYDFSYRKEMPAFLSIDGDNPYLNSRFHEAIPGLGPFSRVIQEERGRGDDGIAEEDIPYLMPYHTVSVIEERIDLCQPSLWTKVQCTDRIMRRILKAFCRDFPHMWLPCHTDYFLDDLVAGRRRYCSSLLVNGALANGCISDGAYTRKAEYWNPSTVLYQFMAEAKRLWDLEIRRANPSRESVLTTIQSGILLNHLHAILGMDKSGDTYLQHSVDLAVRAGILEDLSQVPTANGLRDVSGYTAWALFYRSSLMAFFFRQGPLLRYPPKSVLPNPNFRSHWYGEIYVQYPGSTRPVPINNPHRIFAFARLSIIMADVTSRFCTDEAESSTVSVDELQSFYARLTAWFENLPPCLLPQNVVMPGDLILHLCYYNILIYLFGPEGVQLPDDHIEYASSNNKILNWAQRMLETIIRLYYLRHGSESAATAIGHGAVFLYFSTHDAMGDRSTSLESLSSLRSTMILCLKVVHDQGRIFHVGRVMYTLLRDSLNEDDARLLRSSTGIDRPDIVDENDKTEDILQENPISSNYPMFTYSVHQDPEDGRLSRLLEGYEQLTLD